MVIGGRYGIAVSGIVLMGIVSVSAAMKVVSVASTESSKDSSKGGGEAKAAQVDTKIAQAVDAKQAKLDEERRFKRTVALYRAIFEGDFAQVQRFLYWPVYINGTKELEWWTKNNEYYWSSEAFDMYKKTSADFVWVSTPLNVAIAKALDSCKNPIKTIAYYQIILLLVQQENIDYEAFMDYKGRLTLPLILVMEKRAWPLAELLLNGRVSRDGACHGARPGALDFDGKNAASDAALVNEFGQWKLMVTQLKHKKRSTSCLY